MLRMVIKRLLFYILVSFVRYAQVGIIVKASSSVCAGYENGYRDSCAGDSGGPLVCVRSGIPVQVGITSWGVKCAEQKRPGVYTRLSHYESWITDIAGSENVQVGDYHSFMAPKSGVKLLASSFLLLAFLLPLE